MTRKVRFLFSFTLACLFILSARVRAAQMLIERVGGPHVRLTTATQQPAWGAGYVEPQTGIRVTRLTDVARAANKFSKNPPAYDRPPNAAPGTGIGGGLTNGYSRYSNVSRDNRYFFAFGTGQLGCLYRLAGATLADIVRDGRGQKVYAEFSELRWDRSGAPQSAGWFHYFSGQELHRQSADAGTSSDQIIFKLPLPWIHKGDGDWDNAMRYVACAMKESPDVKDPITHKNIKREVDVVGCFDRKAGKLLPGMPHYDLAKTSLNGVDISPDGKWLTAQTDFYRIEDLRNGVVTPRRGALRGGHGGWAGLAGRSVWVWQESATDYIQYYDPELDEVRQVMPMEEIGWSQGMHIGSIKNPALVGWALVSTYGPSRGGALENQIFMLELKPLNSARHPAYFDKKPAAERQAAGAAWQAGWAPKSQRARIWRLGSTTCMKYVNGKDRAGYYAEAFASINWDGSMISWGSNWWATDNLEIYGLKLPADWHAQLSQAR